MPPRRDRRRRRCRPAGRREFVHPDAARRGRSDPPARRACRRPRRRAARRPPPCRRHRAPLRALMKSNSGSAPVPQAAACAPNTERSYACSTSSMDADQRGFTSTAYGTPRHSTKSMPLTPTRSNSATTDRASAQAACTSASSCANCASPAAARMFPQYRYPEAPNASSPISCRETPSGTARPPAATNATNPGVPSTSSCR